MYMADYPAGTWDWAWAGMTTTGSGNLVIEELETDVYKITGEMIFSEDETTTHTLTISYIGGITPIAK